MAAAVRSDGNGESIPRRHLTERHYINIFFRANLTDRMRDRTFSQCEIANDEVRGLLISKDNATEWSFHLEYDPASLDPKQMTQAQYVRAVRSALGNGSQSVEILTTTTWSTVVRITSKYRVGRVFFVAMLRMLCPRGAALTGTRGLQTPITWPGSSPRFSRVGQTMRCLRPMSRNVGQWQYEMADKQDCERILMLGSISEQNKPQRREPNARYRHFPYAQPIRLLGRCD